jgi:hypothetical protein
MLVGRRQEQYRQECDAPAEWGPGQAGDAGVVRLGQQPMALQILPPPQRTPPTVLGGV